MFKAAILIFTFVYDFHLVETYNVLSRERARKAIEKRETILHRVDLLHLRAKSTSEMLTKRIIVDITQVVSSMSSIRERKKKMQPTCNEKICEVKNRRKLIFFFILVKGRALASLLYGQTVYAMALHPMGQSHLSLATADLGWMGRGAGLHPVPSHEDEKGELDSLQQPHVYCLQ